MTREQETIEILKAYRNKLSDSVSNQLEGDIEAFDAAIEALEQAPCEDAISRQAYIERFRKWAYLEYGHKMDDEALAIRVAMSLSPVKSQEPKTGHWIDGHCSECECDVPAYIIDWKWQKDMHAKYCPNCGAKMVEPQESEG